VTKKKLSPELEVDDAAGWESWLESHHGSSSGVWLVLSRKGSGRTAPTYAEALDVALCFGWIDGQKGARDAASWVQRFCPRGPKSGWSKINVGKAEALIASGKMRPAGRTQVEAAKADGRWKAAYDSQRTATVPSDLQAALDGSSKAKAFFATLSSANRYAVLYRVQTAKRPETRARKIADIVQMLARRETFHPQR
jgi:uncharacterized protein YdeI (YjbR/CyaY-like superfamily)